MTTTRNTKPALPLKPAAVAAQVAVEAVANCPEAFDVDTIACVLANGERNGVASFYLDMLR